MISHLKSKQTWLSRTVKIRESKVLSYYAEDDSGTLQFKGALNLEDAICSYKTSTAEGEENCFEVTASNGDSITLAAKTQRECEEWVNLIRQLGAKVHREWSESERLRSSTLSSTSPTPIPKMERPASSVQFILKKESSADIVQDATPILKFGTLMKPPRNRSIFSNLSLNTKPSWQPRIVKIHKSKILQYWSDESTIKGQINLVGASCVIAQFIEGHDHCFQVDTIADTAGKMEHESLVFATHSQRDCEAWCSLINDLGREHRDTMERDALAQKSQRSQEEYFAELIGVRSVSLEYDNSLLQECLLICGIDPNRLTEIFLQKYLDVLNERVNTLICEDPVFAFSVRDKLLSRKIVIRPAEDVGKLKGRNSKASFTSDGNLCIEFRRDAILPVEMPLDIGWDLEDVVSTPGCIPYVTEKSIRKYHNQLHDMLSSISLTVGVDFIEYDYSLAANYERMLASGYAPNRFGEIFCEEYLVPLKSHLERFCAEGDGFREAFLRKFTGKRIIGT